MLVVGLAACVDDVPSGARWPETIRPIDGRLPLAYLTNNGEDTVSVVSLADAVEVARVPVGRSPVDPEAPHHLAIDAEAGWVFVGLSNVGLREGGGLHGSHGGGLLPSWVQRLSLIDLRPDEERRVDPDLGDIVLTPDRRWVITTHFALERALQVAMRGDPEQSGWGELNVLDAASMTHRARLAVCAAPHGLAITADGSTALVSCYADDTLAVVDLVAEPPVVRARLPVGPAPGAPAAIRYGPYAVAIAPDGGRAFVSTLEGKSLRVYDVRAAVMDDARALALPGAGFFAAFSPDGSRLWVPTQDRDALVAVDPVGVAIVDRRDFGPECRAPHEVVYVRSLARLALVCEGDRVGSGALLLLSPDRLDVLARVEVGVYPDAVRVVEAP